MIGSLLGIRTMLVGITEDTAAWAITSTLISATSSALMLCSFTVFIIAETDPRKQQGK
jgi:hypothetical protein